MIVLDTNVISELMRDDPDPEVISWLDDQPRASMWTTTITLYEIVSGVLAMPEGKRQRARLLAFNQILDVMILGRIATFDAGAAQRAAELEAVGLKSGRPRDARDTMIAGIVQASHATLATRNVRHFEDIAASVVNPWEA